MIAALLGWSKLPQWVMELIVIALVAGGIWYWQHARYEAGIQEQRTVDAADRAKLQSEAAIKTAALQTQATLASQAYEQEHQANLDYQQSHPLEPVRLCIPTTPGAKHMPQTGAAHSGNAQAGTPATNVSTMPVGNPESGAPAAGTDISLLLELFAQRADDVGSVLREFQKR